MEDEKIVQLRLEIIESQKIQADYLKWKLISVATLASIAIGISGNSTNGEAEFLLCAIPFCCAYIDILSLHVMMRILTIGAFLRSKGCAYETFVDEVRNAGNDPLKFENYALNGSSIIFNALPIFYGIYKIIGFKDSNLGTALIVFGIVGIVFTFFLVIRFGLAVKKLDLTKEDK